MGGRTKSFGANTPKNRGSLQHGEKAGKRTLSSGKHQKKHEHTMRENLRKKGKTLNFGDKTLRATLNMVRYGWVYSEKYAEISGKGVTNIFKLKRNIFNRLLILIDGIILSSLILIS